MKRISFILILTLLCCFMLTACGEKGIPLIPAPAEPTPTPVPTVEFINGSFSADSESITVVLEDGETSLLDEFIDLKSADFTGSECYEELGRWCAEHPEVETVYSLAFPNGTVIGSTETTLDLSEFSHADIESSMAVFSALKDITDIKLGAQSEDRDFSWEDVGTIQEYFPDANVDYSFRLFGKDLNTMDERMILSHRKMDDAGAAVMEVLPYMKNCTFLDMDSCGVENEDMAKIRDAFPDIKVVWRIWLGSAYTVRTDVERILASSESAENITAKSVQPIRYCTDLKYLDIGHNLISDLDFLYDLPNLEVLIIAINTWKDATPIGSLQNLEYLEILNTYCTDVSPIANCKNLKHINMGNCPYITDITALYTMTQLERLWIGCITPVPRAQKEKIKELLPDTEINTEVANHVEGGWRKDGWGKNVPRYELLREQMQYNLGSAAYAYPQNDPLYTMSLDEYEAQLAAQEAAAANNS